MIRLAVRMGWESRAFTPHVPHIPNHAMKRCSRVWTTAAAASTNTYATASLRGTGRCAKSETGFCVMRAPLGFCARRARTGRWRPGPDPDQHPPLSLRPLALPPPPFPSPTSYTYSNWQRACTQCVPPGWYLVRALAVLGVLVGFWVILTMLAHSMHASRATYQ